MIFKYIFLPALLILSSFFVVNAQGKLSDYQRAEAMNGSIQNKIHYSPDNFQWLSGTKSFFYSMLTPRGVEYMLADTKTLTKAPAFDHQKLAAELSAISSRMIQAFQLPISKVTMTSDGKELKFIYDNAWWTYNLTTFKSTEISKVVPPRPLGYWGDSNNNTDRRSKSPDGKWVAYIKEFNLYVSSSDSTSEPHQLSNDGLPGDYYSPYLYWSPDSKKITAYKVKANKPHILYLIESSPADQIQPKLHTRNYLKPGDAVQQFKPSLFLIDSMKQVFIDTTDIQDQYDLSEPVWRKDSRAFTFEYNKRGHQNFAVMEVSEAGSIRKLINEESKTFFNYSGKKYRYDLADGKEIIWASERDGWNHLYLFDENGVLKNQITKGNWVVRRVINVNETDRTLLFEGSGMEDGMDPYFIQYYKINLDGTGLKRLTNENGNHKAIFNDDYSLFTDSYSRIDEPSVSLLREGSTGKILMELEKADITPLLNTGWKMPEVFTAKGRDGETDIWGMIIRPSNFDSTKTYPVIEYIYAGPHDSFVPKSFVNDSRGSLHELAELGFIVVQSDGMGTSNRSKAFHDVCWQNLKDAGFPDRIAFMKAAAKSYPYMDLNRVGIFGNSAGGQSSLGALLFHPEFYKVAVSSSGCHDNRMDKIWWNEQWMGYPIGPQYAASSNVEHADKLQGKLLLILGELDDNVDPSSTMQVIDKLIKANKNFDFLMVPGMKHSLGGDYGEHKRRDFFVKHLLGIDPPEWTWTQNIVVPKP